MSGPPPHGGSGPAPAASAHLLAVAGLVLNALVWGLSWWPFRYLDGQGVHALWATALMYALAALVIVLRHRSAPAQLLAAPSLWWLVLASGFTNAGFNWAVTLGDVVRVVLLFYIMPLWSVLLAWWLLDERPDRAGVLRVALALAGAMVVLWPAQPAPGLAAWPVPRSAADWLGLLGGASFALTNVMLRREAARPASARALAMFAGGAAVSAALGVLLVLQGRAAWPPAPDLTWVAVLLATALAFMAANLGLQFGAARLSAGTTAVIMVSEVVFASGSALALGAAQPDARAAVGGALIVAAGLLAAWGAANGPGDGGGH